VFGGETGDEWVLKGGTGMLARVANTRRTRDIDLYREGRDKDESLLELRRLAATDLGDFFSFAYRSHAPITGGENQPHVDGYHVIFEATLGLKPFHPIQVDLAASVFAYVGVVEVEPVNRLPLGRLAVFPYRLYPVANQVADKLTATAPAAAYPEVEAALGLMRRFIAPVLAGTARGWWDPTALEWTES
jgi:hypothetical protein